MVVSLFTETVTAGTRSIVRNSSLLQKMAMPREMFPFASMLVSIYHLWPQFVILAVGPVVRRVDTGPGRRSPPGCSGTS